jgi:rhodanese-related sulfurtransferase
VLVVCASGQRATVAASYLAAQGVGAVPLIRGGAAELGARR